MCVHACRGPTLSEFKQGVAKRYSVQPPHVTFLKSDGTPLPDDMPLNSIDFEFLANVVESSGTITPWVSNNDHDLKDGIQHMAHVP